MVGGDHHGVLIVGCGRSGLAAARLHARRRDPRALWVFDADPKRLAAAEAEGLTAWNGDASLLNRAVWSPGVPLDQDLARQLVEAGVSIVSEVAFAAPDLPQAVAVTGTNGKSTVCSLLHELLQAGGVNAVCGGNLGLPVSELALSGRAMELLVIELSSYQLELAHDLDLAAAIITNLAPDHLDRYPDVDAYYTTKARLLADVPSGGLAVPPSDESAALALEMAGPVAAALTPAPTDEVMDWNRSEALAGPPGLSNTAQAVAVARHFGIADEVLMAVVAEFGGLPHRAQALGTFQGLNFIDDSKATNVAAAVSSLDRISGEVVVLLGGAGKGEDYRALAKALNRPNASAVCFGAEGPAIAEVTGGLLVEDLPSAVSVARRMAKPGSTVLLAPACASFDAYRSYIARGEHFAALVQGIAS